MQSQHKTIFLVISILSVLIFIPNISHETVTLNAGVTLGTSTANITTNSGAITVSDLTISSSGLSTHYLAADPLRTYTFDRTGSSAKYIVDWTSASSSELDFKVITGGITDARGSVTGNQIYKAKVDGTEVGVSFANQLNQFAINTGIVINEILTGSGGSFAGGGGGGGGTQINPFLLPQQQSLIPNIPNSLILSLLPKTYLLQLGAVLPQETLSLNWNSTQDLIINNISVGNSPITVTFPNTPLIVKGASQAPSSGLLPFSIVVPKSYCSNTNRTNCIDPITYKIPIRIDTQVGNTTASQSTTIEINFNKNTNTAFVILAGIIGSMILLGIVYRLYNKKSKKKDKQPLEEFIKEFKHRKPIKEKQKKSDKQYRK